MFTLEPGLEEKPGKKRASQPWARLREGARLQQRRRLPRDLGRKNVGSENLTRMVEGPLNTL